MKTSGGKTQPLSGPQAAALERRVRQELEEQGILAAEDLNVPEVFLKSIFFSVYFSII